MKKILPLNIFITKKEFFESMNFYSRYEESKKLLFFDHPLSNHKLRGVGIHACIYMDDHVKSYYKAYLYHCVKIWNE